MILHNNLLFLLQGFIRIIKSRRTECAWHVARRRIDRKPERMRLLGKKEVDQRRILKCLIK
jgi:hypothetical protein